MNSANMTWEDDDNNRQVRFRVDFTGNSDIEIVEVVPTEVVFQDNRTIGVHTPMGRKVLSQQLSLIHI